MAYRIKNLSSYGGRFYRTIGKVVSDRGELVPRKFLLGTDEVLARAASARLERLWDEVVTGYQLAVRINAFGSQFGQMNRIVPELKIPLSVNHGEAHWRPESLLIAEAVRKGLHEIAVEAGPHCENPIEYVERIVSLRRDFSIISFVPKTPQIYLAGQELLRKSAEVSVQESRTFAALGGIDPPTGITGTLYEAIEAYAEYAPQQNQKEFGYREAAAARRLKNAHDDIPLSQFGLSSLEQIANYWKSRPIGKKTGKPITLDTVTNSIKVTKRFVQWLHRTDRFAWRKPEDVDHVLRCNVARLRSDSEIAALKDGVDIWTVAELATLYRHATDQDRLFILLGLNCGFSHAEACTLRHDEIESDGDDIRIKRIRRKSMVYGEFVLWPETVQAIEWFKGCHKRVKSKHPDYVLITMEGALFDRQRITNGWNQLLNRVKTDHPSFRRLSFKFLRKTASQLIKDCSSSEISSVFLSHGHPVPKDKLMDKYTNRPFDTKVTNAIRQVRKELQPMFDVAPTAFTQQSARRTGLRLSVKQV